MIIEMKTDATETQLAEVIHKIEENGFRHQVNNGEERIVVAVLGSINPRRPRLSIDMFAPMEGVEAAIPVSKDYKLSGRDLHLKDTIIDVKGLKIGGEQLVVMAGPCSVESRSQILACAEVVKKSGAQVLRGGAFKPRTNPYSFRGLGEDGLKLLREAADKFDLLVITEVMEVNDVELVAAYTDIVQIGARNMQNYNLLEAVGGCGKPVFLKRGASADVEKEWLPAADWVLNGNHGSSVILCERGIKTSEKSVRYSLDISSIPVVKRFSHLPVFVDPSHAAGDFHYVSALAFAGIAAGADGLIVEVHPYPKNALSDNAQQLTFSDFSRMMDQLKKVAVAVGRKM